MSTKKTNAAPANPPKAEPGAILGEMIPAREWVRLYGGVLFQSYDSFDWFLRQHLADFAECPDWVVTGKGRFCGPGLAAFVRDLIKRDSQAIKKRVLAKAPPPPPPAPRGRKRKII